jgi:hypothetical protein
MWGGVAQTTRPVAPEAIAPTRQASYLTGRLAFLARPVAFGVTRPKEGHMATIQSAALTVQEAAALRVVAAVMRAQAEELPRSSALARKLAKEADLLSEGAGPRPTDREREEKERREEWYEERRRCRGEAEGVWRRVPRDRRDSLVLEVLGDERLIIREITERMNAALGYPESRDADGYRSPCAVYQCEIQNLVARLLRDGQLEREPETFNKTHMRYRYSRKQALDGPIVDLERAYRDDSEAVA